MAMIVAIRSLCYHLLFRFEPGKEMVNMVIGIYGIGTKVIHHFNFQNVQQNLNGV